MKEYSHGIVLKTYFPQKTKFIIFDYERGPLLGVPPDQTLSVGSHTWYMRERRGSVYLLSQINLYNMPLLAARHDILFLHYIFELCYYGIPQEHAAKELFELLCLLYRAPEAVYTIEFKLAFVFKMFVLLGLYPETPSLPIPHFFQLAHTSVDSIMNNIIHLDMHTTIYQWIKASAQAHPYTKSFKTAHFIQTIGYHGYE